MTHKNYYFTSDTHFSHRNVIKYCNRPFANEDEMNEDIIERWNKTVKKHDIVYHLGDVSFEKDEAKRDWLLSRLNGEKHIVWGNHDKYLKTTGWQKHFVSASDLSVIYVPPYAAGNKDGQRIVLCHYPLLTWEGSHYGSWSLHGHCHNTLKVDTAARRIDVGVDGWNFTPVSIEQLTAEMAKRVFTPIDHHGRSGHNSNDF